MARTVRLQQVSITMAGTGAGTGELELELGLELGLGAGAGAGGLVQAFLVLGQKDHYGWLGLVQTFKVLKGQNDLMARSNFSCFK